MKIKKAVLPSFFTITNAFLGFLAITYIFEGRHIGAAWLIIFAAICDNLDGKIARLSKSQSLFGKELDSLADAVSFGVAPAYLVYVTNFSTIEVWGAVFCFVYLFAGIFRLARFNVETSTIKSRVYKGLTIPMAAITISTFMIMSNYYWGTMSMPHILMMLVPGLSVLMISTVPYGTVPIPRLSLSLRKNIMPLFYLTGVIFTIINPPKWMFPWIIGYIFIYLIRWIVKKLREREKEVELFDDKMPL